MFNTEKYSVVLWKNGHLLQDFLWLLCLSPSAPCCREEEKSSVLPPPDPQIHVPPHSPPLQDPFRFGRFPKQRIIVCWKSLETIKYHLGSFIAALAALGEKRFA